MVVLPEAATSEMGSPCSYDMKPKTEKIANPATKLDPPLTKHRTKVSLWKQRGQKGNSSEEQIICVINVMETGKYGSWVNILLEHIPWLLFRKNSHRGLFEKST